MEKKILSALLVVFAISILGLFSLSASAQSFEGLTEVNDNSIVISDLCAVVDGQKILSSAVGSDTYLFLPSSADLSAVELTFTLSDGAMLTTYDGTYSDEVKSGNAVNASAFAFNDKTNSYDVVLRAVRVNEGQQLLAYSETVLKVMKSENIASMHINSGDPAYARAWIDATKQDAAAHTKYTMALIEADSSVVYDNKLTQIKGRGNSTWTCSDKKPYQIKLDKKTDLLCTGDKANKNKTWVLLANAMEKTLVRNAFAFDLAKYLGLSETPEYRFVDLYFDGEYRGNYVLCEKVQINDGRVEVNDLEDVTEVGDESATAQSKNRFGCTFQYNPTAVCTSEDISGGYLLELDNAYYRAENSWFETKAGSIYVVRSPECATKEQMIYISEFVQEAETAAQYGFYKGKGVEKYFDLDSLASLYIINEYTINWDSFYSSTFFFLPEAGSEKYEHKIYSGPAWDFDGSMGNRTEVPQMQDPTWIEKSDRIFFRSDKVKKVIQEKARVIDGLYDLFFSEEPVADEEKGLCSFTMYRQQILSSARMNFTIWPFDDTAITFALPTYDENCDYTFNFMKDRHNSIIPKLAVFSENKVISLVYGSSFSGFITDFLSFVRGLFSWLPFC